MNGIRLLGLPTRSKAIDVEYTTDEDEIEDPVILARIYYLCFFKVGPGFRRSSQVLMGSD